MYLTRIMQVSMVHQNGAQRYGRWSVRHMFRFAGKNTDTASIPEFYTVVDLVPVGTSTSQAGCVAGSIAVMRVHSKSGACAFPFDSCCA